MADSDEGPVKRIGVLLGSPWRSLGHMKSYIGRRCSLVVSCSAILGHFSILTSYAEDVPAARRALPPFTSQQLIDMFEPGLFSGSAQGTGMPYRLFIPPMLDTARKYPLVVWLHGNGFDEIVHPNVGQLKHIEDVIFREPAHPEKYEFLLLAPQSPTGQWFPRGVVSPHNEEGTEQAGDTLMALIEDVLARFPIDRNRITLIGISSGGNASWEIAKRHPDFFAAVAPLASVGCDSIDMDAIVSVPIWAFRTVGDSPEPVRRTVATLQAKGGLCHLTETPGVSHNCWHSAFHDYDLLSWLLAQRKGALDNPAPGSQTWLRTAHEIAGGYWPHIALLGFCMTSVVFLRRQVQRRASQRRLGAMPATRVHKTEECSPGVEQ